MCFVPPGDVCVCVFDCVHVCTTPWYLWSLCDLYVRVYVCVARFPIPCLYVWSVFSSRVCACVHVCVRVQEIVRQDGRTEVIVDEGIALMSYALDDVSEVCVCVWSCVCV